MAPVNPLVRRVGSSTFLEFVGKVTPSEALAAYPKTQGSLSTDFLPATHTAVARFLLADSTALDDLTKQLQPGAFDDSTPAGTEPSPAVPGNGTVLNVTDQNITARTWCQNLRVSVESIDIANPPFLASPFITPRSGGNAVSVCLDVGASSGLGTGTGLPVVCVPIEFNPQAQAPAQISVYVRIEIPDTRSR